MDLEDMKNNPEQIKLLISMLSALLPDTDKSNSIPEKKTRPKSAKKLRSNKFDGNTVKTTRGKSRGSGINYFDSMPEKNAHQEDIAIDKKLSRYPPTSRRPKITMVSVQCRSCGKKEKVSPSMVLDHERYKCNKCSSSAG